MIQEPAEMWVTGMFLPHCPVCGGPHARASSLRPQSLLDVLPCPHCGQRSEWGRYRLGPLPQDPTYHDVRMNQRFKPFRDAAYVRVWLPSLLLDAWRRFGAQGPSAIRDGKETPEEFGRLIEKIMGENGYDIRFDLEF